MWWCLEAVTWRWHRWEESKRGLMKRPTDEPSVVQQNTTCIHVQMVSLTWNTLAQSLTKEPCLNKPQLTQKVYSRSVCWVAKLWYFCCSTKSPRVRFSLSLNCRFKSQLPHGLIPFGKKQASKDYFRIFPSYSFHLIFQFEEICCKLISPPFSQFLPFGWCLSILFQLSVNMQIPFCLSCLGTMKTLKCRCGIFNLSSCLRTYFLFNS